MKKFILCTILPSLCLSLFAFDTTPFLKPNGNATSYVKTDYSVTAKFGDYYRSPSVKFKHTFDSFGREIESAEFTPTDVAIDKVIYEYNTNGLLTSQSCYDSEGNLLWKNTNTYNASGKITETAEFTKTGALRSKTIFKYSSDNTTDESYYDADGNLVWKNILKYDSNNVLVEQYSYFPDGSLDTKKTYTYNEAGKLVEILSVNEKEEQVSREVFRFNEDMTVSEYAVYNSLNQVATREFYKYDKNGNIAKISTYKISKKFGVTANELIKMSDYSYQY